MKTFALQGDTLDAICVRYYGRTEGVVETVLAANPGLAELGAVLPHGTAVELPHDEFERRRKATNYEWPLLNAVLDGVSRDDLMAGHQSNHLSLAYVEEEFLSEVLNAFIAQALTQNIKVFIAGDAHLLMK